MACYLLLLETGERDLFGGGGNWEDWARWMKWEALGEGRSRTKKITLPDPWIPWDVQMEWLRDFEEGIARITGFRNERHRNGVENGQRRAEDERQRIADENGRQGYAAVNGCQGYACENGHQLSADETGLLRDANGHERLAAEDGYHRCTDENGVRQRAVNPPLRSDAESIVL